jgi:Xaa-Pro aminopeptidase
MQKLVPTDELDRRHTRLKNTLPDQAVFVLLAGGIILRNSDVEYPFRQNSDFWYFTGIDEPDCILVCVKTNEKFEKILFIPPQNPHKNLWTGRLIDPETAKTLSTVDRVEVITELENIISSYFQEVKNVYFDKNLAKHQLHSDLVYSIITHKTDRQLQSTVPIINKLRIEKSGWEIEQLRQAAQINTLAFSKLNELITTQSSQTFKTAQPYFQDIATPNLWEYQLEAEILCTYRQHNLDWSYPPIVASGKNATILHYTKNNQKIFAGDLILIDAGCEYNYYASDITRTVVAGGSMNTAQQEIYDLVLKANLAVTDKLISIFGQKKQSLNLENGAGTVELRNGEDITLRGLHDLCIRVLSQGLIDLNLLSGSLGEVIETKSYTKYYMHGTSHWLGLDVHDAGDYADDQNKPTKLKPGHVFTVEPGIYLPIDDDSIPPELRGIGIRIEDDIVISETGVEVLTEGVEK